MNVSLIVQQNERSDLGEFPNIVLSSWMAGKFENPLSNSLASHRGATTSPSLVLSLINNHATKGRASSPMWLFNHISTFCDGLCGPRLRSNVSSQPRDTSDVHFYSI